MFASTAGYETKKDGKDKPEEKEKEKEEDGDDAGGEKQNASERINLQHIMELREAFDIADTDHGGALELDEFIEAFGEIIGKNMNMKQLN